MSLHLYSDSYAGKNKNYIVLGYFITMMGLVLHDYIDWYFMTIGHTKFLPDEGFGHIRHLGLIVDLFSM